MLETTVKLKKWGSSIGTTFPKDELKKEGLMEGQTVRVRVMRVENVLQKTFGTLKFKKSTEQMMREMDKELYND